MEYASVIVTILFIDLLALVSPGPNFVLTTSAAVSQSRKHALWTAFGIATGSLIWASAGAVGIASVFQALPVLGLILKAIGITYLIYLGIKLLLSRGFQQNQEKRKKPLGNARGYWRGLLVNMTNPKSAAYYASVFAAFLTPEMPSWVIVFLVVSIAAMSLSWHCLIAFGFSAEIVKARYLSISKHVDRLCGAILIFLGLRLAWENR